MDQWHSTGLLAAMTVWSSKGLYGLYQLLKLITVQQLTVCLRSPLSVKSWSGCVCLTLTLTLSLCVLVFLCWFLFDLQLLSHCLTVSYCLVHILKPDLSCVQHLPSRFKVQRNKSDEFHSASWRKQLCMHLKYFSSFACVAVIFSQKHL